MLPGASGTGDASREVQPGDQAASGSAPPAPSGLPSGVALKLRKGARAGWAGRAGHLHAALGSVRTTVPGWEARAGWPGPASVP